MTDFNQQANRMLAESMAQADIEDMAAWTEPQIAIAVRAVEAALHAAQPPAAGVDVTDEMVERAAIAMFRADGGTYLSWMAGEENRITYTRLARAALHAALRTGGGA